MILQKCYAFLQGFFRSYFLIWSVLISIIVLWLLAYPLICSHQNNLRRREQQHYSGVFNHARLWQFYYTTNHKEGNNFQIFETTKPSLKENFIIKYSRRRLNLILPSLMFLGPNYIMRYNFKCYDTLSNIFVSLPLCFTAADELQSLNRSCIPNHPELHDTSFITSNQTMPPLKKQNSKHFRFQVYQQTQLSYENVSLLPSSLSYDAIEFDFKQRFLQNQITELIFELLNYLQIVWFVTSGSTIGAYRHFGNIPWDDDVDVTIPLYQIARLKAFFNQGNIDENSTDPIDIAARQWWDYYITYTRLSLRQLAETRYLTQLGFWMTTRNNDYLYKAKIYWKHGDVVHTYEWRHPFVDIFAYTFVHQRFDIRHEFIFPPKGTSADHVYFLETKAVRPLSYVFPLHFRPFDLMNVPLPYNLTDTAISDADHKTFPTFCNTGCWNHYEESLKPIGEGPCCFLYDKLPFITERRFLYVINQDKSNLIAALLKSEKNHKESITNINNHLQLVIDQQQEFNALLEYWHTMQHQEQNTNNNDTVLDMLRERYNNASIVLHQDLFPPIVDATATASLKPELQKMYPTISSTDFSFFLKKETVSADALLLLNDTTTPPLKVLYEKLSMNGVILAEMISLVNNHVPIDTLSPSEFFNKC